MRFSVIVPVYKVEKYLDECIHSLTSQSFSDFEIILVDDKSPDNCPKMCDEYADLDPRVKVIHKPENQGLGFARNTGLKAALGDYVLFVDSDDTVDLDTLKKCDTALADSPDILVYGMKQCFQNEQGETVREEVLVPEAYFAESDSTKAEMFKMLSDSRVFQYACNKAYRREFLLGTKTEFEKTALIEDFLFNIDVVAKAKSVKSVPEAFYFYRKPSHQTLASAYNPDFYSLAKRKFSLEKQFLLDLDSFDGGPKQQVMKNHIKHIVSAVLRNSSSLAGLSKKRQRELLREMLVDSDTQYVLENINVPDKSFKILSALMRKKQIRLLMLLIALKKR